MNSLDSSWIDATHSYSDQFHTGSLCEQQQQRFLISESPFIFARHFLTLTNDKKERKKESSEFTCNKIIFGMPSRDLENSTILE